MNKNKKINLVDSPKNCCGCAACLNVCPVKAIEMVDDLVGHTYPKINDEICVKCHRCEMVCAFKKDFRKTGSDNINPSVYAIKIRDLEVRKKSSSGGAFTAISDSILNKGGAIACTVYDYKINVPIFKIIETEEERNQARGSKYIQSDSSEIFQKCLQWLKSYPSKELMFIGTGCQVAAFQSFMNLYPSYKDRIVTVDLICHGVPGQKVWKDNLDLIIKKTSESIKLVQFKDKTLGWNNPLAYILTDVEKHNLNLYSNLFYSALTLRPSCYCCPYARVDRKSDLTVGDFWGIENVLPDFYDNYGISLVLVHSKRGRAEFQNILKDIVYRESDIKSCLQPRLLYPPAKPKKRKLFWHDYLTNGSAYAFEKYGQEELIEKNNLLVKIYRKIHNII